MKSRLMLITVIGLAIALFTLAILQGVQSFRRGPDTGGPAMPDLEQTYLPPVFRAVEEEVDRLILRGSAEPESVLIILDQGARIRQVQADETGSWAAEIGIAPDTALSLMLQIFIGETSVLGDETLLRLPAPGAEDGLSQKALILITAPGGPSRIIQNPFGEALRSGPLSLDALEYDPSGGVILAGRSEEGGRVRLSGPTSSLGETAVESGGRWFFILPDVSSRTRDGTALSFQLQLFGPETALATLPIAVTPLAPGQSVLQDPEQWQVRRQLEGGGSQTTVIFAQPIPVEDEDADG